MSWIMDNLATIVICLVFAGILAAIIVHLVRNKKKGVSSCGCGCGGCSGCTPSSGGGPAGASRSSSETGPKKQ